MQIFGHELNGGVQKTVVGGIGGVIVATLTAVGSYVLNAASKVDPLIEKTTAIKEAIDIDRETQRRWNDVFLDGQTRNEAKQDAILKAVEGRDDP